MKHFCIVNCIDVTQEMIDESISKQPRESFDGLLCILKFNTKYPNTMAGRQKYTRQELLYYMNHQDNCSNWKTDFD